MHQPKWILNIGLLVLTGCVGPISPPTAPPPPARLIVDQTPPLTAGTTLQIYRAAADCNTLVAETQVVTEATLEQAVGGAIATFQTADFPIAGYRVQQEAQTQVVTIDLRLPPNASRPWASLSPCEQFALFGSVRQTVMQFEPGQVQTVEFTHQGQAIAF